MSSRVAHEVEVPMVEVLDYEGKEYLKWTEEDFWREMTELYIRCKTAEDVRSVKQILELKAKTMGLLEEKVV